MPIISLAHIYSDDPRKIYDGILQKSTEKRRRSFEGCNAGITEFMHRFPIINDGLKPNDLNPTIVENNGECYGSSPFSQHTEDILKSA